MGDDDGTCATSPGAGRREQTAHPTVKSPWLHLTAQESNRGPICVGAVVGGSPQLRRGSLERDDCPDPAIIAMSVTVPRLSRLETAIATIDATGFQLGYCVPPPAAVLAEIVDSEEPDTKRPRIDNGGEAAPLEVHVETPAAPSSPTVPGVVVAEDGDVDTAAISSSGDAAATSGGDSPAASANDRPPHSKFFNLQDSIAAFEKDDAFSCGGRFVLNDADRMARLRFDNGPGADLRDFGNILNMSIPELIRSNSRAVAPNPSHEKGDHIGVELATDFRLGTHTGLSCEEPDDITFLEQIRARCAEVFNVPSVTLRRRYLRVYSKGGYSKLSIGSPRIPKHTIATVIVCLPSMHTGGQLVISHCKNRRVFKFNERANSRDSVQWAAFYSDCEYEIKKIKSGHQLLVFYDACVAERPDQGAKRQYVYKQIPAGSSTIPVAPTDKIDTLVAQVGEMLSAGCPVLGLFTWYTYTLSALNAAPLTLKGLDRRVFDALTAANFRVILVPVTVRLPYEDDACKDVRVYSFTREDIEYMEGAADAPSHDDLVEYRGTIPFMRRADIETYEFSPNEEVETTYMYSAMIVLPASQEEASLGSSMRDAA
ncbi:unnamed protein product (mitochondrion) [Plasmodiophora brassicae]|uniref:Uncharacterized protein n=2 Tax=Plasmodiophora brassicae TaxID=37360 RepID=A0A3P3YAN1_PLABS|nr:unnamed protein product [Plasmodiophora brassicae]